METFAPKGNIYGPILPQFVLQMSITFGAKTMYAILCDYAADKDHCWPSQATLAKRLSCSISSVKNYLAELVRENSFPSNGSNTVLLFTIFCALKN